MLDKTQQDSISTHMNDLFGDPPLMRGEDSARYWRLHAVVRREFKPTTDFEELYVREYTDKLWQHQRYKRGAASIVEAAYVEALASLLRPFNPPVMFSIGEDPAAQMAREYYSGEAKPKREQEIDVRVALPR